MWLGWSLEWELDFPGGFRDKTLGDGFKLSVCFIACGVLEQHKDVSRCCVVMSHTGHPLTLTQVLEVGDMGSTSCLGPIQAHCWGSSTSACLCHLLLDAEDAVLKWLLEAFLSLLKFLLPSFGKTHYQSGFLVEFCYWEWCAYAHTLPQMATENQKASYLKNIWIFLSFPFLEIFMFCGPKKMASSHFNLLTATTPVPPLLLSPSPYQQVSCVSLFPLLPLIE